MWVRVQDFTILENFKMRSDNNCILYFCGFCSHLLLVGSQMGSTKSSPKVLHPTWFWSSHGIYGSSQHILSASVFCPYFSFCIFNSRSGPPWGRLAMRAIGLSNPADISSLLTSSFSRCSPPPPVYFSSLDSAICDDDYHSLLIFVTPLRIFSNVFQLSSSKPPPSPCLHLCCWILLEGKNPKQP